MNLRSLGVEILSRIVKFFIPSKDPGHLYGWQWAVVVLLFFIAISGVGALAWAQGKIPGLSGVATKDDLKASDDATKAQITKMDDRLTAVERVVNSLNLRDVKASIQKSLENSCIAQQRHNQDALNRANDDLYGTNGSQGYLDQYQDLTGRPFSIPPCTAILITPGGQ